MGLFSKVCDCCRQEKGLTDDDVPQQAALCDGLVVVHICRVCRNEVQRLASGSVIVQRWWMRNQGLKAAINGGHADKAMEIAHEMINKHEEVRIIDEIRDFIREVARKARKRARRAAKKHPTPLPTKGAES